MSSIPVVTHDHVAVGWRELAHTAIQTYELLFVHAALKTLRRRNVLLQRVRLMLPKGCPPDIPCHSVTISKRARTRFARFYFSNHNVNHLIEQLIRVGATLVNEIPDQLASDGLILLHGERISRGKPT
jgi:hypothetical protein